LEFFGKNMGCLLKISGFFDKIEKNADI